VVADEKESLVLGDLVHSFGVKMHAPEKYQDPGRAVKEPTIVAVVLVIKFLGIDHARADHQKKRILKDAEDQKYK
jgi:hypothetical protein